MQQPPQPRPGPGPVTLLRRRFSNGRFFGGIGLVLLTAAMVGGCTYSAGHSGIYFLLIAIPGFGAAFSMIAKPWRYECVQCNSSLKAVPNDIPLDMSAFGYAQQVANSGDPAALDRMIREAPLPGAPEFCVLGARVCKGCGQAGMLQLMTYKFNFKSKVTLIDKVIVEFGAHVRPDVLSMVEHGGEARWVQVQAVSPIQRTTNSRKAVQAPRA